jgi:hypothetical protein
MIVDTQEKTIHCAKDTEASGEGRVMVSVSSPSVVAGDRDAGKSSSEEGGERGNAVVIPTQETQMRVWRVVRTMRGMNTEWERDE